MRGLIRRIGGPAAAAALIATTAVVPAAGASLGAGPTAGGFASDGVEYVAHVPLNNDTAGARIVGKYMYLTTSRDLRIFDLSKPESPHLTGSLILPQQPYFSEEDPDTNGKILLVGAAGTLNVIDVEDKSNPEIIGRLAGADAHTTTCVLGCRWAYNSDGKVIDLRDPTKPKQAGEWGKGMPAQRAHDVTEVAPGMVLTSSNPMLLLDARRDPARPKLIGAAKPKDERYMHGNLWPRQMKDRFVLVGSEAVAAGPCDTENASFMTWDASRWRRTRTFTMVDEYQVEPGLPTDGDQAYDLYCGHWFDEHPTWRNGGLVAVAWYEHGTRFLHVDAKGDIHEAGWFVPLAGSTSAAYWVTDDILYAVDYNRGLDILRWTGKG